MTDEISPKDVMFYAIAAFFAMLAFGGCQLLDSFSKKIEAEAKAMEVKK